MDLGGVSGLGGLPDSQTKSLMGYPVGQGLVLKTAGSLALGIAGMYFLAVGRKEQSLNSMLFGGALILLSLFLF